MKTININGIATEPLIEDGKVKREKEFLSFQDAASYLAISKSTLYKHTSACNIPYYKPNGKLILFKKSDLDNWIRKGRIPSNDEIKTI